MANELTDEQRRALSTALGATRRVREWRRYRAVLLAGEGRTAPEIAATLQVSEASIYNWLAAWRDEGLAGLHEGVHPGLAPRLDAAGLVWLDALLGRDPQEYGYTLTGWTVPALQTEAASVGYQVSSSTLRRAIRRLDWRWKRPKYVLGRPDPDYQKKRGRDRARPGGARRRGDGLDGGRDDGAGVAALTLRLGQARRTSDRGDQRPERAAGDPWRDQRADRGTGAHRARARAAG
jgi:transposase